MKKILIEALYLYYLKHKLKPYIICLNCPDYLSQYAKNGIITLNLSNNAAGYVNFKEGVIQVGASFGGKNFDLEFDIDTEVIAIYPYENQKIGMFFQLEEEPSKMEEESVVTAELPTPTKRKSHLRRVK